MRVGWKDSTAEDKSYIRVRYRYREICFSTTSCMADITIMYYDNITLQFLIMIIVTYYYYNVLLLLLFIWSLDFSWTATDVLGYQLISLINWWIHIHLRMLRCLAVGLSRTCICGCFNVSFHCRWVFGNHPVKSTICLAFNHFENSWDTFLSCHVPCTFHHQTCFTHSQLSGHIKTYPAKSAEIFWAGTLAQMVTSSERIKNLETWNSSIDVVFGRPLGEITPHDFPVVGDGHQHESRALYTHYKDFLLGVGWPLPQK